MDSVHGAILCKTHIIAEFIGISRAAAIRNIYGCIAASEVLRHNARGARLLN
jgi:hypothetical protein